MKIRNLLSCGLAAAALLLPTACAEEYASTSSGEKVPLRLTAGTAPVTRAATNIQSTVFDAGETINAYITASDGTVIGAPTVYTTETASGGNNPLTPDVQPYFPQDQTVTLDIYALYPSIITSGTTAFTVCADQREDADYKSSDLMYASLTDVTRTAGATSTTANLPFTHKMAKLIVSVEVVSADAASVGTVTGVRLKNVYRRIGFTPSTGTLGAAETLADQGDIWLSNDGTASACLFPPQSLQRGDFLEVTTTNGTAAFALALSAGKAFEAGHVYTVKLQIGAQNLKEVAAIDAWPDDKNLEVLALGAGSIQIDEIADQDYTGSEIEPAVTVTSGGEVLTQDTHYTLKFYNNTAAGYGVAVATGIGTYAGKTAARSFLIRSDYAVYTGIPAAVSSLVYSGAAQNLITAGAAKLNTAGTEVPVKYCLTQNGAYSTTIPQATNAGTYTVWYKVDATDSYSGIDSQKVEVTIAKAPAGTGTVTPPTACTGLVFNEQRQQLVNAGSSTAGFITYCLGTDATNAPTSGYTTDIPKVFHAGTYYVWWQVGDDNHEGTTPQCVTVTVGKATGHVSLSSDQLRFYASHTKGSTKILTADTKSDGAITATCDNTTDISLAVSGNKITVRRLTNAEATATITVSVAEGTDYLATSATCNVMLDKPNVRLSDVKSTAQKYVGYIVTTDGYLYGADDESMAQMAADGKTAAGIISYVGTTNTTHGFVLALHDCNNGATCSFSAAPAVGAAYTPTISGYSWKLGTYEEYQQALSNYDAVNTAAGSCWDDLGSIHWTSTLASGLIIAQIHSGVEFEWCYAGSNFIYNPRITFWHYSHVDNCKVRSLLAF